MEEPMSDHLQIAKKDIYNEEQKLKDEEKQKQLEKEEQVRLKNDQKNLLKLNQLEEDIKEQKRLKRIDQELFKKQEEEEKQKLLSISLDSAKQLEHCDTQQFDETQKKIAKIIKYPENFENWTEEECLKFAEEPNDIFPIFRLAILNKDYQLEKAKEYLLKVIEMDPLFEVEKVNWALGTLFVSEKEWKQALHHFNTGYKYSKDRAKQYLEIARCYQKLGEFDKAERRYRRAIDANNKDYLPYYKLGWMQIKNKQLKDGIDNLAKAQTLDYQNMDIIIKLGESLMLHDEDSSAVDEAVNVLHKGMIVDPLNYQCTNALARAYEKKGDLVNAIKYGKLSTEQPNSNSNSHYFLGTLYMKKKDFKNAAEAFRTLLRINSEHPEALIEYATISSIQGNFEKAKKYLKHALKSSPNNPVANMRLGRIFQTKLNEVNQAIECFQKVARVDPKNYKAYYYIGQCYIQKGELNKGIECMNQSLKINQDFGLAWKAVGNIMYEKNQPAKALRYFQKAIESDKNDMEAKIGLGNCYYLQEQFEQAVQIYEEISHLDQNEELEYNMANCYYMKGDYEEAVLHYEKALSINPDKVECYQNLGNTYCIMEKFEEAHECFEKVVKDDTQHSAAFYIFSDDC